MNNALERREAMISIDDSVIITRTMMLQRLRNMQRITRLQKAVHMAKEKLFTKLRSTYEDDATITSRIDILCEDIEDKLKEIDASIRFLEEKFQTHH
jgi:Mg2+ and Co2+ transporter CorA